MLDIVQKLSSDGLAIFLFHGVVNDSPSGVRNYTNKHLKRDYFYDLMHTLREKGQALSMDEVIDHNKTKKPFPPKSFVITFDDGFENNYSIAAPILRKLEIPTTFYVTTGFIENNLMSWIDRIELCLESTKEGNITFPWGKAPKAFKTTKDKELILEEIRLHVKTDSSIDVDALVENIFDQCQQAPVKQSDHPLDLKMTWQQIKELSEDDYFLIGGHAHTHRVLSFLSEAELENEIKISANLIKEKVGVSLRHYSYPEGLSHCYSNEVIEVLKRYGVQCCPSAEEGINRSEDSLFHLKRIPVVR